MSRAKAREPVTLVRSPMMVKLLSGRISSISSPEYRDRRGGGAGVRGGCFHTASAIALMCAGVVPQQPPTTFSQPSRANSPSTAAIDSGVSSNPPRALGRPALG